VDFVAGVTVLAIWKPCCEVVSSRRRGEKGLGVLSSELGCASSWARDSLLGVACEPLGILGVLSACGVSGAVGHVSRSLGLTRS